ncbi:MAG: rRNA maturation RNase YbeY [Deltaproteobacteria bacterium RBG_13_53_10]|jgi:rRNA maturation RNase YbeY|nr:MAG: rRNA maturation RNase YbeY [Deltaproteobacteria bacterium RBG_13_53_10]
MEVQITFQRKTPGLGSQKIKRKLKRLFADLDFHEGELSILFTDDERIAELNRRYLRRKGPTNVLAFPMLTGSSPHLLSGMLGDVVISVDTAISESQELGEPLQRTVDRLLIHGILHLLGYDHEGSPKEALRMRREENRLMTLVMEE